MTTTTIQTAVATSKAEKARDIFAEAVYEEVMPKRAVIINRLMNEAGLSKPAASTYLQNLKREAGFIV